MKSFRQIGHAIYNMNNPREVRRYWTFRVRAALHKRKLMELGMFFDSDEVLQDIAETYPFVYEQPTRAFFYCKSNLDSRIRLMREHMTFLKDHLRPEVCRGLYNHQSYMLWEDCPEGEQSLQCELSFDPGQRKEGLLSVMLYFGDACLYQMIFWIARDKSGEYSLYIGAMQGPNMEGARDIVKKVTKRCHAYRTKNLILYLTQAFARGLGMKHIYAVTNQGYYAMNHVRVDRKLKTDFSEFWLEAGGYKTEDECFYELPLTESRKTMEEVPTRKRAVYRRRFAMLDEVSKQVAENVRKLKGMEEKASWN